MQFVLKVFPNFADVILSSAFLTLYVLVFPPFTKLVTSLCLTGKKNLFVPF